MSVVVIVSAGSGPAPVRRFVAALAQHLAARAEAAGAVVVETAQRGTDAEPSSVELVVEGSVEGVIEAGTHALVARSEDRGRRSRKRWFARVSLEVLEAPERGEATGARAAALDPRDVEITATTAGGPGGQHVNKTATAVRARHRPTGLTVRVSDERSQRQNVSRALERLAQRLADIDAERRDEARAERRLGHHRLERGVAVQTYHLDGRGRLARDPS